MPGMKCFLSVLAALAASAAESPRPCREHPKVVAKCFAFRGRLANYNGAPTARLWRVGGNRMYGVSDSMALPEFEQMPANAREALGESFERHVFGDFEFCPFTPERPGVMQFGCIDKAKNLKIVEQPKR